MKRLVFIFLGLIIFNGTAIAQKSDTTKPIFLQSPGKISGSIFTGMYCQFNNGSLSNNSEPSIGFELKNVLLMYNKKIAKNIEIYIVSDVGATTRNITVTDSSGLPLDVSYTEGSKFTPFIKGAEIHFTPQKDFRIIFGQILLDQFMKPQNSFWGYRFIDVTLQEKLRWGIPSDLGAKVVYTGVKDLKVSLCAANGEGAKRIQDDESSFLLSTELQYIFAKNFIAKAYVDYEPGKGEKPRMNTTGFLGYKHEKFRIGGEFGNIQHLKNIEGNNVQAFALYSSVNILPSIELLARYDNEISGDNNQYIIGGVNWKNKRKNANISLNYRHLTASGNSSLFLNLGIFF